MNNKENDETCWAMCAVIDGDCTQKEIAAAINEVAPKWGDMAVEEIRKSKSADWSDVSVRVVLIVRRGRKYWFSGATLQGPAPGERWLDAVVTAVHMATANIYEKHGDEFDLPFGRTVYVPVGDQKLHNAVHEYVELVKAEEKNFEQTHH